MTFAQRRNFSEGIPVVNRRMTVTGEFVRSRCFQMMELTIMHLWLEFGSPPGDSYPASDGSRFFAGFETDLVSRQRPYLLGILHETLPIFRTPYNKCN